MKKVEEAQPNYCLKNLRLAHNWTQADVAEKINTTSLNVSRWERGVLVPCLHFRQKLCELFGKNSEELGLFREEESPDHAFQKGSTQNASALFLRDSPRYWQVPYQRNPFFTGREDVLQRLHEMLRKEKTGACAQSYALSGTGGIGKTQIVLEYVYRSASAYDAIFWIGANTRENILTDFSSIADVLNLPEKDDQDQNRMVNAVKRWFHTHKHWLLIFDDIEDPELVKGFLPAAHNSTLLLTTQRATPGMIALNIEIEPMSQVEATQLLLLRSQILEQGASPEQIAPIDALMARKIAESIDGLPLALDQAGAYIAENKCSLAEFLRLFQEHPLYLLDARGFCTEHPLSVAETFSLAFKKIQQKNSAAADLLTLCCFLAPDAIPEAVFLENASRPLLQKLVSNTLQFNTLLKELLSSSLIYRNRETRTLKIHPLVQVVLKGQLDECVRRQWAEQVVKMLHEALPDRRNVQQWPLVEQPLLYALEL